ncbi:TIGR03085 family metal-binding protein [Corynebacterium bovis]|uniref:TIGR03085 family metal-binding protein n=1 Tax=Corynebacterium bovis TaxID=36808 RepID=UPI002551B9BB|nr:TIGR03085 family metal-binding protein [Corynebacterium bovis]MDK8510353.1 TIGR03085 family metal-binding protein [Corynebacterium bovis]
MSIASRERRALADLLLERGPDAPTLCEGWTTKDLAVHLVVREYRPDAAAGMVVPRLAGHLDEVSRQVAARGYADAVRLFRAGPPWWSPMALLDPVVNLAENIIHHEDVRRAGAAGSGGEGSGVDAAPPRDLPQRTRDAVWRVVRLAAPVFLSTADARVTLRRADPGRGPATRTAGRSGAADPVTVSGDAVELLLWLYGRDGAAQVVVDGPVERATRTAI